MKRNFYKTIKNFAKCLGFIKYDFESQLTSACEKSLISLGTDMETMLT